MAEGDSGATCLYLPLNIVQTSPGFAADIGKLIILDNNRGRSRSLRDSCPISGMYLFS